RGVWSGVVMKTASELRSQRSWPLRAVKAVVVPSLLKNVALFLTLGDANEAYYRRYGISDERFVGCFLPIDVGYYDSIVARRECCRREVRSALGIPANHKVLLTVGKLLPRKR